METLKLRIVRVSRGEVETVPHDSSWQRAFRRENGYGERQTVLPPMRRQLINQSRKMIEKYGSTEK